MHSDVRYWELLLRRYYLIEISLTVGFIVIFSRNMIAPHHAVYTHKAIIHLIVTANELLCKLVDHCVKGAVASARYGPPKYMFQLRRYLVPQGSCKCCKRHFDI